METIAVLLLLGLSVAIAQAHEKPTPQSKLSTATPQHDWRLAKANGVQPHKIGVLTYYPNNGGGYTFRQGERLEFYSLPYRPTTSTIKQARIVDEVVNGKMTHRIIEATTIVIVGTSKMPFGGQTFYRSYMTERDPGILVREDTPIATLSRNALDGNFRLSIQDDDSETQLKLKSIRPVLEHAEHGR